MNQTNGKNRIKSVLKWVLWVVLIQFLLFNISAVFYGYRLTYFYNATSSEQPHSKNIFIKTWDLFAGPRFQKSVIDEVPHFPFETVHLTTRQKLTIEGWYVPTDSARGTVILVHGLGQNKSMLLKQAYEFMYYGYNVLLIDLRAHGNSSGNVSTLGVCESEDVKLAYDYIVHKGEKNIVLYGVSLGATVIAKAIYDYALSPSRVILETPFDGIKSLFEKRIRMLGFPEEPFGSFITFWASIERRFNGFTQCTSKYAERVKCPVLLEYGELDQIVSTRETKQIFDHIASKQKRLVEFKNAYHEFLLNKDPGKWRTEMSVFLGNDSSFSDGHPGAHR